MDVPCSVLVANRGEIARRIIATARRLGIETVVIHTPADADLPYVTEADVAIEVDVSPPIRAHLDIAAVIAHATEAGVEAVHPGYGFLAENADFATAVRDAGMTWIGPGADTIHTLGNKINARALAAKAGVAVSGSSEQAKTLTEALEQAAAVGYPVMLKAAAGGGGIGMVTAHDEQQLTDAFTRTQDLAERSFGSGAVFIERFLARARHIEVQILGLTDGRVIALGERDCSVQRRHQKIAEESPAPGISDALRASLLNAAVHLGESIGYRNAGTVEFLVEPGTEEYVFLEVNTRIQVEHPVTELLTGVDLVEQQFRIAAGLAPTFEIPVTTAGHAVEFRIYAEDPVRFFPSPGHITTWTEPSGPGIRVDSGYAPNTTVTPHFDPLLAKLCTHGPTREEALDRMREALDSFIVEGPKTNLPFLRRLVNDSAFRAGDVDTALVARMQAEAVTK